MEVFDNTAEFLIPSLSEVISEWDSKCVCEWLKQIGLEELIPPFQKNRISGRTLLTLELQELGVIGIDAFEDRKNLLTEISKLKGKETFVLVPCIEEKDVKIESNPIGSGAFGEVYLGEFGKKKVAAKKLNNLTKTQKCEFFREARIGASMHHPCVIRCYGYSNYKGSLYLLLEYASGGTLDKFLQTSGNSLSVINLVDICYQIADGIQYIHRIAIHRGKP